MAGKRHSAHIFFMHQHEELHSPELCKYVIERINEQCGTVIPVPEFVSESTELLLNSKEKGQSKRKTAPAKRR